MKEFLEDVAMAASALAYSAVLLGLAALMVLGSADGHPPKPADPVQASEEKEAPTPTTTAPAPAVQPHKTRAPQGRVVVIGI